VSEVERQQPSVHQVIKGEGHQVAGNDIHNHTYVDEYQPSSDNPNLQPCKICGWPISAINPTACGKCGHDYVREGAIAAERARKDREGIVLVSIYGLGALVGVAAWTSSRTSLDFLNALAVCGVAAVAIWGGWCWLRTWCSMQWQSLKRRWWDGEG